MLVLTGLGDTQRNFCAGVLLPKTGEAVKVLGSTRRPTQAELPSWRVLPQAAAAQTDKGRENG